MFRKKSSSVNHMKRYSAMVCSTSLYSFRTTDQDKPACGFLNRKTVLETSGKKSKDRQWVTFWCQVKEGKLEFYKVNGFTLRPHEEPPPKDIYPPPNRHKQSAGFVFLENCLVEIDFTSQEEKDLDKRRRFLFRLILSNKTEYIFQSPSENIMLQWVTHIKKAIFSLDPELNGPSELLSGDARIKASRCSINKKSKYNTNSVRVKATIDGGDDEIDSNLSSLIQLDPRLVHLRKRLQNKRELMRQLHKMLSSFSGDTQCLYRESETLSSRLPSSSGSNPPEIESDNPVTRYSACSNGSSDGFTKTTTTLLEDYYMLPGVEWSHLKKGETVEVLGKLPNGWYRCRANKDTSYELEEFPSSNEALDESINIEEEAVDVTRDELMTTPTLLKEKDDNSLLEEISTSLSKEYITKDIFDDQQEDIKTEKERIYRTESIDMAFANSVLSDETGEHKRDRTESYLIATVSQPIGTFGRQNLIRKDSYNTATSSGSIVDSIKLGNNRTRHLSIMEPILSPSFTEEPSSPQFSQEYELKKLRINNILDHEKANNKYIFPLVGLIPSSVLRNFICHPTLVDIIRPSSSTSDYESSTGPALDSNSFNGHVKSSSYDANMKSLTQSLSIPSNNKRQDSSESFTASFDLDLSNSPPIKPVNEPVGRRHSDRSLSLPTSSLIPLGYERESVSEAVSPEPVLDYLENEDDIEREEEQEIGEGVSELRTLNRERRMSSKKLKVIPSSTSPTTTLERNISETESNKRVISKEGEKRKLLNKSNSEDNEKLGSHKGLLSRIRSNFAGLKKGGDSPKHHRSVIPSNVINDFDDSAEMRSRVTSISGKAMRSKGMGITFGDSSSESESEDTNENTPKKKINESKSTDSSPLLNDRKQMSIDNDCHSNNSRSSTPDHEAVFKTQSTPLEILKFKAKARIQSDSTQGILRKRGESNSLGKRRNSFLQEGTSMSGFIQAPPRGVRRSIYLDPTVKKFGFHLEKYELLIDEEIVSQTIVQHVVPGSPAFLAGFFPGDQIVSVNGQDVKNASVQEVANAIQKADPNRRIEIVVMFVEGAIRIKKKQEHDDLQMKLSEKQNNLTTLIINEQEHSSKLPPTTTPLSPISPITMFANDLQSWKEDTPPEENSLHMFNYNHEINSILSLHHGDIASLSCDLLVIPLRKIESHCVEDNIRDVLKVGGDGLIDELSLAKQCELGTNIYTQGHGLPVKAICHCVYSSSSDDDIFKCCRHALKVARQRMYQNIVFWVSGFISTTYVSPHHIICSIRGWLEEGVNCSGNLKVVLSVPDTPAMISLIERYFPLEDYKLYDFLQELNYYTSDDDDDMEISSSNNEELPASAPKIPPRLHHQVISTPITKSPLCDSNGNTFERTRFVKTKFTEIDDILNNIHDQVSAMK